MNLSDLIPKFRIEIRRAGSTKRDPWEIADLAHTQNHVTARLPFWKNNPDIEHRVVDNLPAAPQPVRLEPAAHVAAAAPETVAPVPAAAPIMATSNASGATAILAPTISPAAQGLPTLPFKTGDRLQDKNVADHPALHVAEINPDGKSGFNVEFPGKEMPGWFVPAAAAHHFHLHGAKAAGAKPSGGRARKSAAKKKPAATAPKKKNR